MLGESKIKIFDEISPDLKPVTLLFAATASKDEILQKIEESGLEYPLIFKPDVGERGLLVEKIDNETDLDSYLEIIDQDFLVQEYIDLPIELGVMYYRYPNKSKGKVSSIVVKEMLSVKGDGKSTVRELVLSNPRAKLQLETLEIARADVIDKVLDDGEELELVPIGNHSRGTAFYNGNHLINQDMDRAFDKIASEISGFYIGRFDLRCASIEALNNGDVKILELNGAGAEPAHIYHPGFSLIKAYKTLFKHMRTLLKISRINNQMGVDYMTLKDGWYVFKQLPIFKKAKTARS